ncbi:protein phosphatase 1 regulatory subunit 32 isoform X2 [Sturnira hondurensis]|uniref:protein phosphatase 1 regulatory subunit 32 isoform X1 n=1 Tax=Sturnira hondurensis TaxID=192404 RepID=UPI001879214F|nr:protein phosphatase 1 regulatory subunit 32 isoform X1 [Sturnira hondurensis]XP_036916429.1 protein phosphatase 1 regulatory subunit 32 isoform X1 [Sturnira hondurensis]XP_036916430.1 protein phosphatase 1 regulatory subunit 32 isoform X2 [Sturnira hondurensis]
MMGKLPLGVVSPYVKMSSGGCTDPLKFYATSYCVAYGEEEFKPRMGSHTGTGYKSNYRPVISSQASLNALDNPATGERVQDNFQTVTSQSYRPLVVSDGTNPLPGNLYQTDSGYSLEKAGLVPTTKEVRKVHFDTQDYGPHSITGLEPKHRPLLYQQQRKGSLEWENAGHGPRFMTSEYNSKYLKEPSSQPDLLQKKSIGAKEESSFTKEATKNPVVFQPPSQALPGDPVLLPGRSVTKSDFVPMTYPHGHELLPQVARGSERETGFSRVNERTLSSRACPPGPEPSSMSHWQFQHPQRVQQTNVTLPGREIVGNKEPTGYSLNNPSYVRSPCEPNVDNHYLTTYNQGYLENTPKGLDQQGWTQGSIQPQKPGGYALNQPVTGLVATPKPTESLRHLHPHVGRTLISTDPFYRPMPYSSRFNTPH